MRSLAFLLVSALSLRAQGIEVAGKVLEVGTNLGIYDATVLVSRAEGPEVARLTTDTQGNFRFTAPQAASYRFAAQKNGFRPASLAGLRSLPASVTANATTSITLFLGQNGTITGRILDSETNEPVANMPVQVSSYLSEYGRPLLSLRAMVTTDAQGAFSAEVPADRYMVYPFPGYGVERMIKAFTEADASETDLAYEGTDLAAALPLTLPSGGRVDAGTLRVGIKPRLRARVRTGGACSPDQQVTLEDTGTALGSTPCGSEVLVIGLQPGRHVITGTSGTRSGRAQFDLRDANVRVELSLALGATLSGRLIAPAGASVKLQLSSQTTAPDPQGAFRFENLPFGRSQLQVNGLSEQFYVKEIRFNGAPAPAGLVDVAGNASVEVEIADQPAILAGTTSRSAEIVLIEWPMHPSPDLRRIERYRADESGEFFIPGLAPGDYRVFAVSPEKWETANEPAAWPGLVASAEKVILTRGTAHVLDLRLSEPR